MNNSIAFVIFAFVLLFSNAILTVQSRSAPFELYDDESAGSKIYMVLPAETDFTWLKNSLLSSPVHPMSDQRLRRGWGGGRRRRSISNEDRNLMSA